MRLSTVHSGSKIKGPISPLFEKDQSCTVVTTTQLVVIGGKNKQKDVMSTALLVQALPLDKVDGT